MVPNCQMHKDVIEKKNDMEPLGVSENPLHIVVKTPFNTESSDRSESILLQSDFFYSWYISEV